MRVLMMLSAALMATSSHAAEIMDNSVSKSGLPSDAAKSLPTLFLSKSPDPYSAQFLQLTWLDDTKKVLCGYVNLKNGAGAYQGFQPFAFIPVGFQVEMMTHPGCPALDLLTINEQ